MKRETTTAATRGRAEPAACARLRARLGQVGPISEGYVQDRGPGAGGPCYQPRRA